MKKLSVLLLMQLFVFGTACYGAVSEDMSVYVRKDVFEVYMRSIDEKLTMILEEQKAMRKDIGDLANRVSVLAGRVDKLEAKVDSLEAKVDSKINALEARMSDMRANIDGRFSDLRNDIYLGLVILGIVVGLPAVQKMLQAHADRKPSFTLEDVKRLIEENNAKLSGKPSV